MLKKQMLKVLIKRSCRECHFYYLWS